MTCNGRRWLYQEGAVTQVLAPTDLIRRYLGADGSLPFGTVIYCGTLSVIGSLSTGERFEIELEDPIRNRSLRHAYNISSLAYAD
jgi:2-keto-4-pentenoate hydratase/2-oxohepta-3-ene-1,7-dioic acid hydratase in catechol pathway